MPRLSIDVSPEEHQKLKVMAALRGQSLKDFVLSAALGDAPDLSGLSEEQALAALKGALQPRIAAARAGERSSRSIGDIAADLRGEHKL